MGAAGRDFHNFNVYFRNNDEYEVVAFTATQIPYISDRKYPPELSGSKYPNGIPIFPEEELPQLIKKFKVEIQKVPSPLLKPMEKQLKVIFDLARGYFVVQGKKYPQTLEEVFEDE